MMEFSGMILLPEFSWLDSREALDMILMILLA